MVITLFKRKKEKSIFRILDEAIDNYLLNNNEISVIKLNAKTYKKLKIEYCKLLGRANEKIAYYNSYPIKIEKYQKEDITFRS